MKILVLNDTHIRGTTPQNRVDDFSAALKGKLLEIKEIVKQKEVDFILHGGDLFDRPDTAPSVVSDFIQILRDFEVPIYIVAGNHDLYGHNPTTLPRTMLGLLDASGIVEVLNLGKERIIESGGIRLQLQGSPYFYDLDSSDEPDKYLLKKRTDVDYAVNLVHGFLLPQPLGIDIDYTLIDDIQATEADITITGHYHTGFGIEEMADRQYCLNPGSIVRVGAYPSELNRIPQVAVIELASEGIDIRLHQLDTAKSGEEVLDRSQIELNEYRNQKLADFTQSIKGAGEFNFLEVKEILDELADNKDLKMEVKKEARDRITKAEEDLA